MTSSSTTGLQNILPRCEKCRAGPRDVSGHSDLYMHAFIGTGMMLKCRACGTCWVRSTAPSGGFVWSVNSDRQGVRVPMATQTA